MTDYTPEELDGIADFAAGIANKTAKALAEYPRLKKERDELLKLVKSILADDALTREKVVMARELMAKVEK